MVNQIIEFEKTPEKKFFMLDGIIYCKFGKYGLGFNEGEKVFKVIDPKTLVENLELKDIFSKKS